ncbi:MAG: hypothetical protein RIK87_09090 [Fuerstiella sp.]
MRFTLLFLSLNAAAIAVSSEAVGQPATPPQHPESAPASPYVQRMMSLDRDRDGFLSGAELPGKLAEMLKTQDTDDDGKLSPAELAAAENQARAARDTRPADTDPRPGGSRRRAGRGGAPGRGGGRPGGRASSGGQGSPLDAAQILRFALTFDGDGDGGLNAQELRRYAAALAERRARSRRQPENANAASETRPAAGRRPGRRPPLDSEAEDEPERPSGPARGLGADGDGGGGFGDMPKPKNP